MRKFVFAGTGAAVAVAAGLVALAGPAAAAEPEHNAVITRTTTGYSSPDNGSRPVLTDLPAGKKVTALCFTEGQELGWGNNPYWFRISQTIVPDGNTAFVHRHAITVDANADLPHC